MTYDKMETFKKNACEIIIYMDVMNSHLLNSLKLFHQKDIDLSLKRGIEWDIENIESMRKILAEYYDKRFDESFDICEMMAKHRPDHRLTREL